MLAFEYISLILRCSTLAINTLLKSQFFYTVNTVTVRKGQQNCNKGAFFFRDFALIVYFGKSEMLLMCYNSAVSFCIFEHSVWITGKIMLMFLKHGWFLSSEFCLAKTSSPGAGNGMKRVKSWWGSQLWCLDGHFLLFLHTYHSSNLSANAATSTFVMEFGELSVKRETFSLAQPTSYLTKGFLPGGI